MEGVHDTNPLSYDGSWAHFCFGLFFSNLYATILQQVIVKNSIYFRVAGFELTTS